MAVVPVKKTMSGWIWEVRDWRGARLYSGSYLECYRAVNNLIYKKAIDK